jgi:hypothetical protein
MEPCDIRARVTPLSEGPDTVILGAPIRFGVGYDLGLGITTIRGRTHIPVVFLGTAVLAARWRLVIPSTGWVTDSYATECITLECFIARRIS